LLKWYKAKKIEDDYILNIVKELAEKAEIPVPEVFVAKIEMPNAFALGRNPKKGKIVLTEPLLNLLDRDELKAVIAHEIVHIKNQDTLISGLVAVLAGILVSISTLAFWASLLTGFGQEDDPAPNLIKLFVLSLVAPVAAVLVYIFISSSREYLVDKESIKLHEDPTKSTSSLEKLNKELKSRVYEVNVAHAHLFTVNPLHRDTVNILDYTLPTYASLFNTNPSIINRLKKLKGKNGVGKVKARILARPLFYTFMSNMLVLFAIIVVDTFNRKDFDFGRASIISAVYLGALTVFLLFFLVVFLLRRR
jgi:heat shock protein HtpX